MTARELGPRFTAMNGGGTTRLGILALAWAVLVGTACTADDEQATPSAALPTVVPSEEPAPTPPPATPTPAPSPTPTPTPSPSPEPSPTAKPADPDEAGDPYAVPDDPADIDEAYIQRVLDVMDELYGAAFHALYYDDAEFGDEAFVAPLQAAYTDPAFGSMVQVFDLHRGDGYPNLRADPGLRRRYVSEILFASGSCIDLVVASDFSEIAEELPDDHLQPADFTTLVQASELDDPEGLNPTPWQISNDTVLQGTKPEGRCES